VLVPLRRPDILKLTDGANTPIKPTLGSKSPLEIRSPIRKNMSPKTTTPGKNTIVLGPLTSKYLPRIKDSSYGIYHNAETNNYMIGKEVITFKDDNLIINGKTYKGTEGLFRLLTHNLVVPPRWYEQEDFDNYKEILISTDSLFQGNNSKSRSVKSNKGEKYNKMIADIWWNDIKPYIPPKEAEKDQIETASQEEEKEGEGLKKYTENPIEY